jgi:hypothetical protein
MILTDFLEKSLNNGHYRLTYEQIAMGVFNVKVPHREHIDAIKHSWHSAQKQLRRMGTCVMLVTDYYFAQYSNREPQYEQAMTMCIAAHGRDVFTAVDRSFGLATGRYRHRYV